MKRIIVCAGIVAACVCLAAAALVLLPTRPGITKANFDRVKFGMKYEEVEPILGPNWLLGPNPKSEDIGGVAWVRADGAVARVQFANNSVTEKEWEDSDETITDTIRRWLNMQKVRE